MDSKNKYITLVNTRGRVVEAREWEVETLKAQGCKVIVNPRETYYPQYDQTRADALVMKEVLDDDLEPNDLLQGEEV